MSVADTAVANPREVPMTKFNHEAVDAEMVRLKARLAKLQNWKDGKHLTAKAG